MHVFVWFFFFYLRNDSTLFNYDVAGIFVIIDYAEAIVHFGFRFFPPVSQVSFTVGVKIISDSWV